MKVMAVFTGGTIGSSENGGVVSADIGKPYYILEMYKRSFQGSDILWETAFPYEELSENLTCSLLSRLIVFLRDNCLEKGYDGIIVTHGTDTLQYTAAALSYCFGDSGIPIVLVSSNYILEDDRSNGFENFACAVEFIRHSKIGGVFVSYKNSGECTKFHLGTRLIAHKAYSDDVESLYGTEYGVFADNSLKLNHKFHVSDWNTDMCKVFREAIKITDNGDDEFSDVLWIHPYVGMCYQQLHQNIKAVLHDTYHSGTICSKASDIEKFAADAKERKVPVFICGCGDSALYESKKIYGELGFKVLPVASPVAMYIKLWLCVKSGLELDDIMAKTISGDFVENLF